MPTPFARAHLLAALFAGTVAATGFAACVDPYHLDPAPTGGASSSTGSGSSGCKSNADCPFPTAICDTARHACVGCLTVSDCAYKPGAVCNRGKCDCPAGGCGTTSAGTGGGAGGAGGAGVGGSGGAGGADAGDGAPSCAATCNDALMSGGVPCSGTTGESIYTSLQNCAGCGDGGLGPCASQCTPSLCDDNALTPTCESCLNLPSSQCAVLLSNCMAN